MMVVYHFNSGPYFLEKKNFWSLRQQEGRHESTDGLGECRGPRDID